MTDFIFLTSGPIDYQFPDTSLYESIIKTSLGLRFPFLKKEAGVAIERKITKLGLEGKGLRIFSASSRQTKETAKIVSQILKTPFRINRRLDPILFDFSNIMSEEEFVSLGNRAFDIARPKFLELFYYDKLLESKASVKERIDSFLEEHLEDNQIVLSITHSFLLMVMKAYLVDGDNALRNYQILCKLCRPEKRPFRFLEGLRMVIAQDLKVKSLDMVR